MPKGKEIRRSFSREFKLEAVRRLQARPDGVTVAHIGRELGVRPDMLRDGVHIPESTLDRASLVERGRPTSEIDQIHRLDCARDGVPTRQPHSRPGLNRGLASRQHVVP